MNKNLGFSKPIIQLTPILQNVDAEWLYYNCLVVNVTIVKTPALCFRCIARMCKITKLL